MSTSLNIAQRINAAMAEVDYVQKEKKPGMNYSIVSHDAVTAKVRPILQKHGIVYYPQNLVVAVNGNRTEAVFEVRFENMDDRSDFIDVATFGFGVDPQDKGPGKAMSYGVKYALLKVLGLETGDDPDEVQDARANYQPEPSSGPAPRTVLDGPHTSKTALKNAIHTIRSAVAKATSEAEIDDIMRKGKDTVKQANRDWPDLLDGDPNIGEDEGLRGFVALCRETIRVREAPELSASYDALLNAMRQQQTSKQLSTWADLNEEFIAALEGEEGRLFQIAYDEHESGLKLVGIAHA